MDVTIDKKYVNMADVIFRNDGNPVPSEGTSQVPEQPQDDILALIELMFFAYRDFTGDPDDLLSKDGFGRAHHRILHFVHRNPGMRVADLLDILQITKQSLGRVLRQLVDRGYIEQRQGASDRRERRLYPTRRGSELAATLTDPQRRRIAVALEEMPKENCAVVKAFLLALVNEDNRAEVRRLIAARDPSP